MVKSLAGRALNLYARCLARAPYKTQAITTAALWAAGDVLSQKLEGRHIFGGKQQMDWQRTMATAAYGGACIGAWRLHPHASTVAQHCSSHHTLSCLHVPISFCFHIVLFSYSYMHAPNHTCSHLFTHVYTCSHLFTHIYTCSHLFTHIYMLTPVHTCASSTQHTGPFGHYWYINLDKVARMYFTAGSKSFIAFKVLTDTAVFGPLHIAAFFSYMVLMEGGTWKV